MNHTSPVSVNVPVSALAPFHVSLPASASTSASLALPSPHFRPHWPPQPLSIEQHLHHQAASISPDDPRLYPLHSPLLPLAHPYKQQAYHLPTPLSLENEVNRADFAHAHYGAPLSGSTFSPTSSHVQTRPQTATATLSSAASSSSSSRLIPIHRIPAPSGHRAFYEEGGLPSASSIGLTVKQERDDPIIPQRPVNPRAYTNPEGYASERLQPTLPLPHLSSLSERRPHLAPPSALNIAPYHTGEPRRASAADILTHPGYLHPASAFDRSLRSPHPPLTATLAPHLWAHPPVQGPAPEFAVPYPPARPYHSSPLDAPSPALVLPPPIPSAYSSHSPVLPLPNSASPLFIPAPLRFDYSTSPPSTDPRAHVIMPRAAQTTRAVASNGLSRTNGHAYSNGARTSASGWGSYVGSTEPGRRRENPIYIPSDTPEIPRKRTRAMAAAEAQSERNGTSRSYANGSVMGGSVASAQMTSSSTAAGKKRKVEEPRVSAPKKVKAPPKPAYVAPPPRPLAPATTVSAQQQGGQTPWDDAEGHYIVKVDDVIASKYKIIRLLGQGTFGKVVEARDIQSRRKVAIKIIRAVQKYRDASKIEIRVLKALKQHDPNNIHKCVHLDEYLDYRNHPCLVTELYGMSVFDFLKQNAFQPFPERHIQDFARHLLRSVAYVHSLRLVHTDLKPENILLVSNEAYMDGQRGAKQKRILRNTDIRLIDFGSATFEDEYHSSVVSTRHYRAPEIILGLPWSYPCDMFSIGCILVEFYTGDALFQTHDNIEHLGMMEVVMGKMPKRMIDLGRSKKPEFFAGRGVDYPNPQTSKSSRKFVKGLKNLKDIVIQNNPHNKQFYDLIKRMLDFDPDTRIDVQQALDHPYFRTEIQGPEVA